MSTNWSRHAFALFGFRRNFASLSSAERRIGPEKLLSMIKFKVLISASKQMPTLNLISLGSKFSFLSNAQT